RWPLVGFFDLKARVRAAHDGGVIFAQLLGENHIGQRVEHLGLNNPFERTRSKKGIEATLGQIGNGGVIEFQQDAAVLHSLLNLLQLNFDDVGDHLLAQRFENHYLVNTVDELRSE